MKVLIIRDHRPGHYNQSEGILRAIGRFEKISVEYVNVNRRPVFSWHAIYSAFNLNLVSDRRFEEFIYPKMRIKTPPDLVISSGGETLLYNVLIARRYKSLNIFSGSIRNLDPKMFTAILTPYQRYSERDRYIYGLKPCPVDPDQPPEPGRSFDFSLLIGGASGTHKYLRADWLAILQLIRDISQRFTIAVFSSRRTPAEVERDLKRMSGERVAFFDPDEVCAPELFDYCKRSQRILVTEDSNSMITEAICCRKPVLMIAPATNTMSVDELGYLQHLMNQNWLSRKVIDASVKVDEIIQTLDKLQPMSGNHLDSLAEKLRVVLRREDAIC